MKHSPGPWKRADPHFAVKCKNGHIVCHLKHRKKTADEANINLIAAAPEMLEALQNIENDDGRIPAAIWELRNKAIAKATGSKP